MTQNDPFPPSDPVPPPIPPVPPPIPPVSSAPPAAGPTAPPAPYAGPPPSVDDRNMAVLAHALGVVTGFVGPLVIWLMQKDKSPFAEDQGKEALNFQITLTIGYLIGSVTSSICIGFFILPAVFVVGVVFGIIAAMDAGRGKAYRYPIALRLVQ